MPALAAGLLFALDRIDVPGLLAVHRPLTALLRAETARIGPGRTVVAGFSQGATVALTLALRYGEPLAGTALYAPFLPPDLAALLPEGGPSPANSRMPVWIGHGARDWIVPESSGAGLRDLLASWGHPVTWQRYPGGHEAFAGVRASLPAFLSEVLATPIPPVPGPEPSARAG
ncbi:alpha/beta hydrolase [Streptomyces sp. SudanB182_2057]|uniref:alpha/beta hydrolase n=1 Tax=Streptomyces sp. SudanB182_2057 TaxID=3035281 RepID=UPI003F57C7E0